MEKKGILLLAVILLSGSSYSINAQSSHAVNFELGGPGLEYSINYEYGINPNIALRGGYSVPFFSMGFFDYQNFILTGHYKIGQNRGKLDLGGGAAIVSLTRFLAFEVDDPVTAVFPVLNIGYRNEPVEGSGFQFKIAFTPLFSLHKDADQVFIPWGGLSLGYKF